MRVGCGSAAIGMFATQWKDLVDEVVVVDDHITGVVSEHQAGKVPHLADNDALDYSKVRSVGGVLPAGWKAA